MGGGYSERWNTLGMGLYSGGGYSGDGSTAWGIMAKKGGQFMGISILSIYHWFKLK